MPRSSSSDQQSKLTKYDEDNITLNSDTPRNYHEKKKLRAKKKKEKRKPNGEPDLGGARGNELSSDMFPFKCQSCWYIDLVSAV